MANAGKAKRAEEIERPPEPDLLLKLMAQAQQGARYWPGWPHQATVGDVSPVGKGLSKFLHLSARRSPCALTDPLPLDPFLGLRHVARAARHSTR